MTSSIDTNVVVALLDPRSAGAAAARHVVEAARGVGELVVLGCVFAELMAGPGRAESDIEAFLQTEEIRVEWDLGEAVWRLAGERYRQHCVRRRERGSPDEGPRRILTDFLIGSHAMLSGCELVTFDQRLFRVAFPEVVLRMGRG